MTTPQNINTTIRLSAPPHLNNFKLDDVIAVVVDNKSQTAIEIAPDRDLKIFWWKNNSWNEVKNEMDYLSTTERISPQTADFPGQGIYTIVLKVPEQQKPIPLCVTLEGIEDPDDARTKVATYLELSLDP